MNFHIADSFTTALARLTGQEQKAVKTAAFDLQLNRSQPGLQLHRLADARDPNFWSARVNQDIRLIVHRTPESIMLAYVDHHDKAYAWAERRRIETHHHPHQSGVTRRERARFRAFLRERAPSAFNPSLQDAACQSLEQ